MLTERFGVDVQPADRFDDAAAVLRTGDFALVLVNRKLDVDYSDGIDVIRGLKDDARLAGVPVMLITNYAEHQEAAVAEGAVRGFGKLELNAPETIEKLAAVLGTSKSA